MIRIQVLDDATEEQLKEHGDVCAICYCDMTANAKVIDMVIQLKIYG